MFNRATIAAVLLAWVLPSAHGDPNNDTTIALTATVHAESV